MFHVRDVHLEYRDLAASLYNLNLQQSIALGSTFIENFTTAPLWTRIRVALSMHTKRA